MSSNAPAINRLHSLDALRGAAALAVVFWHWQHFGAIGSTAQSFERELQPQYQFFKIFYDYGWLAVDLFFSLSGFIFFWLYSERISERRITPTEFFVLRFSRLYPLHIATLLFVTFAQIAFIWINGRGFVYKNTDIEHFILNLFLITHIGLEKGYSYNGPIWSVSIESLLYVVFFIVCMLRLNRPIFVIVAAAIGFSLIYKIYPPVGRGIESFFLGGFTYTIFTNLRYRTDSRKISIFVISVTIILWISTLAQIYLDLALKDVPVFWRFSGLLPSRGFAEIVLFPTTILSLALYESQFSIKIPCLEFLGSISYSSYLLHFPLQISFALLLPAVGLTKTFFQTSLSLILFFTLLIALSAASFRYLEMPAQRHIRKRWLTPRSSGAPTAGRQGPV